MIKLNRNGDGSAFINQNGQFVFIKDGVNFALSYEQMDEMEKIFIGLRNGDLLKVDPNSDHMLRKRTQKG